MHFRFGSGGAEIEIEIESVRLKSRLCFRSATSVPAYPLLSDIGRTEPSLPVAVHSGIDGLAVLYSLVVTQIGFPNFSPPFHSLLPSSLLFSSLVSSFLLLSCLAAQTPKIARIAVKASSSSFFVLDSSFECGSFYL